MGVDAWLGRLHRRSHRVEPASHAHADANDGVAASGDEDRALHFLGAALLAIPYLRQIDAEWRRGILVLFLIPSGITLAFPFAMIGAVDAIRRFEPLPKHVERAAAVKLGLAAVAIMVFFGGWVVPASNETWRSAMSPRPSSAPAAGLRELSTYELMVDSSRATAEETYQWSAARAVSVRRELNSRASLALLPVLLLWRRWRALDLPSGRWYRRFRPGSPPCRSFSGSCSCASAIDLSKIVAPAGRNGPLAAAAVPSRQQA